MGRGFGWGLEGREGLWIGLRLGVRRGGLGVGGGMLSLDWWEDRVVVLMLPLLPRRVKWKTSAMGFCSKMMLLLG